MRKCALWKIVGYTKNRTEMEEKEAVFRLYSACAELCFPALTLLGHSPPTSKHESVAAGVGGFGTQERRW